MKTKRYIATYYPVEEITYQFVTDASEKTIKSFSWLALWEMCGIR